MFSLFWVSTKTFEKYCYGSRRFPSDDFVKPEVHEQPREQGVSFYCRGLKILSYTVKRFGDDVDKQRIEQRSEENYIRR